MLLSQWSPSIVATAIFLLHCHVVQCQFVRREYRMLSDGERAAFHNALQRLKANGVYDQFSRQHLSVSDSSAGAHKGPAFLPWHREFLSRFEQALGMAIPYWDSVMDSYLPNPRDSMMFTGEFMGGDGTVSSGPGAFWRTLEGRTLTRRMGTEGRLMSESVINNVLNSNDITALLGYTAPRGGCPFGTNLAAIEYHHSSVHLWLGGDMRPPTTSCNDPIFWPVHSFVDYIWEMWRQSRQSRSQRENDYPPDDGRCSTSGHFANSPMIPLGLRNIDGLSNRYTDGMYRYAPRPQCPCNSPYLFCSNRGFPHCVAKVRPGGQCSGYEGEDVCYNGVCQGGSCSFGGGGGNFQQRFAPQRIAQQQQQQSFAPSRRRPRPQPSWDPRSDQNQARAVARAWRPAPVRRRPPPPPAAPSWESQFRTDGWSGQRQQQQPWWPWWNRQRRQRSRTARRSSRRAVAQAAPNVVPRAARRTTVRRASVRRASRRTAAARRQ